MGQAPQISPRPKKLAGQSDERKMRTWSDWKKPDFVAKAGDQPSHPSGGSDCQIRYKLDYQDRLVAAPGLRMPRRG
jgi:hypothetical protein